MPSPVAAPKALEQCGILATRSGQKSVVAVVLQIVKCIALLPWTSRSFEYVALFPTNVIAANGLTEV